MNRWEAFTIDELIALFSAVSSRITDLDQTSGLAPEYVQLRATLRTPYVEIDTEGQSRVSGKIFGSEENE